MVKLITTQVTRLGPIGLFTVHIHFFPVELKHSINEWLTSTQRYTQKRYLRIMWKSRIDRCLLKPHIEPRFVECQAAPDWTKNQADPRYCPGSNFAANHCYLVGRRLGRCWCLIGRMSLGGLQQHWTDSDRAFLAVVHPRYQVVYLKSGTLGHMSIGAGFSWHRMRGDCLLEKVCTWRMSLDRMAQVICWGKWHTGFPLANFVNGKTNEWVCMLERSFLFHFFGYRGHYLWDKLHVRSHSRMFQTCMLGVGHLLFHCMSRTILYRDSHKARESWSQSNISPPGLHRDSKLWYR